ncbi:hypothetical protein OS175_04495 [Marinicella sp. S1101]|nr:hypothetical protein [Marinicella marina]MDJ1138858.1 hypothetical protein [Marinicella marina]
MKIERSIDALKTAFRFNYAIMNETIPVEPFRVALTVGSVGGPQIVEEPDIDYSNLIVDGQNIQVFTLACCCIAIDEAFGSTLKQRNPASDMREYVAWSIIYQLRNAFAHTPLTPKWDVKKTYKREYSLKLFSQIISVDLTELDGQDFNLDQIGGVLSLFELIEYCKQTVSKLVANQ